MDEEISVGDAIKKIQGGEMSGKDLPRELLRDVIQVLRSKGQEQNVIAKFLGYSDRQIRRVLRDIRKANRFAYTENTHTEHIGWFVMSAQSQIDFLTRTYNSANSTEKEKIVACIAAWKVAKELTEALQSLGVLPSAERAIHLSGIYEEKRRDASGGSKTNEHACLEGFEDLMPIDRDIIRQKVEMFFAREISQAKAEMLRRKAQVLPPAV